MLDRVCTSVLVSEGNGTWAEYPGGYSDMLSQRKSDAKAEPVEKPAKPAREKPASKPAQSKRRLSMKEMEALKTLPKQIDQLTAQREKLEALLGDPDFHARDRVAAEKTAKALDATLSALEIAEEKWLELEMRREELEG